MKKFATALIAAVLTFFCLQAFAQTVPRPPCIPGVNGYPVGTPKIFSGAIGRHVYWFCSDSKGAPPKMFFFNCLHEACSDQLMGALISQVTRASARVTTAHAAWDAHVKHDCSAAILAEQTLRGALCRETMELYTLHGNGWPN